MKTIILTSIALIISSINLLAQSSFDSLALTPPMGWNSWNTFRYDINEDLVKEVADVFIEKGLKDAGYEFIVMDDAWQTDRDENGNIIPDPQKFPSGIKALADYVHSKGLKFGLYSDAGYQTCGGYPGSRGYEYQDARQYAAWGIDYLKYDWCNTGNQSAPDSYKLMKDALVKAGRPIVFSICEWGMNKPWEWGEEVGGNLWRTTFDIRPCWDCSKPGIMKGMEIENFMGFTKILDLQENLEPYAGPGHWNDPDMLEVGNGKLTYDENVAHFSLWSILAAPLMLGNDIRNMSNEILSIITNKEVIAVNQDKLGRQGRKVRDDGNFEVWSKDLADGNKAVILFNRSASSKDMQFTWSEIGMPEELSCNVRDLWLKEDMGRFIGSYKSKVPSHGVVMVKVMY